MQHRGWLAVVLSAAAVVAVAALCAAPSTTAAASRAAAPAYFYEAGRRGLAGGAQVDLVPPRRRHNDDAHSTIARTQDKARWLRRQDSSGRPNASLANAQDKLQSLGFLGDAYNAPMNISSETEPQLVFVQLDTGSSDLWLVSARCQTAVCKDSRVIKFDETKSSSYHDLEVSSSGLNVNSSEGVQSSGGTGTNATKMLASIELEKRRSPRVLATTATTDGNATTVPFTVTYDDDSQATGILGVDNMTLANLGASQQIFGLVNDTNITLSAQGISGILGLGFTRGSAIARSLMNYSEATIDGRSTPLLSTLLSSSNNSYPLFSLSFTDTGGRMTVGAVDSSILSTEEQRGLVQWHDVEPFPSGNSALASNASSNVDAATLGQYVYWALRLSAVGVGGQSVDPKPTYTQVGSQPLALLDSGTQGIVGPFDAVSALFDQIDTSRYVGDGRWAVPCTATQRMFFSFGGRNLTFLPTDYIIGPASGNPYLCLAWPAAVQGSTDGIDWVLGQAFLRAQYTIFSLGIEGKESPKIGLYPLRASANATSPSQIFAPQDAASVSAFVQAATPIATTLPNSLITVPTPASLVSSNDYLFANATTTPSPGYVQSAISVQGAGGATSTFKALISASSDIVDIPAISNGSTPLPVPFNPAERDAAWSVFGTSPSISIITFVSFIVLAFSSANLVWLLR